jgi:hypothetical protein
MVNSYKADTRMNEVSPRKLPEAAVDIKRNAWEYAESKVRHITIFEPAT